MIANVWEFGVPYVSAIVGAWLVTYACHSTVLLLATRIVVAPRRTNRRMSDILWKAAMFGGIVTTSVALAIPARPALGTYQVSALVESRMWTHSRPDESSAGGGVASDTMSQAGARVDRFAALVPNSFSALRYVPALLVVLWIGYAAVVLARVVRATTRARRALGPRRPPTAEEDARFRTVLGEMGHSRAVQFTVSDALTSPVALGDDEITVPRRLLTDLSREEQSSVVAHEVAHLIRRDPWWLLAMATIESLFFFQPLHRMARRHWQDNAEYLCDALVARRHGMALSLARALACVAEWLDADQPLLAPALAEPSSSLLGRVRALLDDRAAHTITHSRVAALSGLIAIPGALLIIAPVIAPGPVRGWGTRAFAWAEVMSRGSTLEIQGVLGAISAEPADGDAVEVRATRHGRTPTPDVHFAVVRHAGGVTICAVYPSPPGARTNQCTPGAVGTLNNSRDNDVEVEFAVRIPRGVLVMLTTLNGRITTGPMQSVVTATTLAGDIDVTTSEFARARSNSGNVRVSMARAEWAGTLELSSLSGNIGVTLPADAHAEVTAQTSMGKVDSDFLIGQIRSDRKLVVSTTVGNIQVRKRAR